MADKNKNNDSSTCGCGRPDLYEELLKQNKSTKEKDADSTASCEVGDDKSSVDEASEEDQKQTKN